MTELKHCHACGQDKPRDQFGRNRSAANGLESYCKPCHNRRNQEYRATIAVRNPELAAKQAAEKAARNRQWRLANPDKEREHGRRWRAANAEQVRERRRQACARIKAEVFDHYGWACACCGATARPTIDHIDGNGKTHRYELFGGRINPSSREFYRWLIKNGFPEGFQTLCHRCNTSKGTGPACGLDHTKAARATRVARTTRVAELQKRVRELECQLAAALEALELCPTHSFYQVRPRKREDTHHTLRRQRLQLAAAAFGPDWPDVSKIGPQRGGSMPNVHDDDEETLDFADESEWMDEYDDEDE